MSDELKVIKTNQLSTLHSALIDSLGTTGAYLNYENLLLLLNELNTHTHKKQKNPRKYGVTGIYVYLFC